MDTTELGKTGKQVSVMALGCMRFGFRDEAITFKLIDQYIEAGGRFLDTANMYGESENILGRYFDERGNREEIFLATKVGANPTVPDGYPEHIEGLSAKAIESAVDESLKALRTDYIDLYYAHIDHRESAIEETLATFNKLIESGKVRHFAYSNTKTWRIERAKNKSRTNGWAEYCGVQQKYSYLRPVPGANFDLREVVNDELLDYCANNDDFTLLAYAPLLGAAYTRPDRQFPDEYLGPDSDARLKILKKVAKELDTTPNQVVLAWLMQSSPEAIPLVGASTEAQLMESLDAAKITLSAKQIRLMNEANSIE